jgi:hypothetical protein
VWVYDDPVSRVRTWSRVVLLCPEAVSRLLEGLLNCKLAVDSVFLVHFVRNWVRAC